MRTRLAILLATGLFAAGPAAPCAADSFCSCAMQRTQMDAFDRSDAVFRGIAIDAPPLSAGGPLVSDQRRVRIRVLERFRGDIPDTATVYTAWVDAVCGYPFEEGEEYVVHARAATQPNRHLAVHLCSGTRAAKDADLRELRRIARERRAP